MTTRDLLERFRGRSCLVTGGAGFIGSNLCRALLSAGAQVTVLDNLRTGKLENLPQSAPGLDMIVGDLTTYPGLRGLVQLSDYVFHLAAAVGNLRSIEDPEADAKSNVIGSVRLYNACRGARPVKVVYSSSSAMFGEPKTIPMSEEHPQDPQSFYALSKMTAEHYGLLAHSLWGVPTVCLRYFNVYGTPMEYNEYTGVISIFFERLLGSKSLTIYGDGSQYRDFVYVRDVVQANLRAAALADPGSVFNVGTGRSTTIRGLAEAMIQLTEAEVDIEYADARPGEVHGSLADVSKARRLLRFDPEYSVPEGLGQMWDEIRLRG